ncbi:Rv3235 family protein [Catellatospora vulcania]|uniref:Rv3235 family protein n=1 Tax=Catellatospora vulcania TaxID=1460450 RepID=UPI0012D3FE88|nr:Rv3235 family protein [Catellatospora vulcania]
MTALAVAAGSVRIHRAPPLDPPFDDELRPTTYRPVRPEPREVIPPEAVAGASPECHTAALRFLNLCLELFNGFRSPSQLRPLLRVTEANDVLEELSRGLRRLAALRQTVPASAPRRPVRRRQLRTCEPRPGVAEVAAVLSDGRSTWSVAYRLERDAANWRCTALTVLL